MFNTVGLGYKKPMGVKRFAVLLIVLLWMVAGTSSAQSDGPAALPSASEFCGVSLPARVVVSCPKTLAARCLCFMNAKKAAPGQKLTLELSDQRAQQPKLPRRGDRPRCLPPFDVSVPTLEVYFAVPKPPPRV